MGYVPPVQNNIKPPQPKVVSVALAVSFLGLTWMVMFGLNMVTLGGVPFSVLLRVWQDPVARTAYFMGNGEALYDRISDTGIQSELKAYYRPKISDEAKLDQFVHQILYRQTGYVGEGYELSDRGKIILKNAN